MQQTPISSTPLMKARWFMAQGMAAFGAFQPLQVGSLLVRRCPKAAIYQFPKQSVSRAESGHLR
jgi:hypothetical protein